MRQHVTFVEKDSQKSLLKIKIGDHCHFTGKYRGAAHVIKDLMYLKKFQWFFTTGQIKITTS